MSKRSTKSLTERVLGEPGFKKRVNSKVKGNLNEREVAKALSRWAGVEFRRTPASGAIHVPLDWLCGDVFCTDKDFDFPFSVETKHYKKITPRMVSKFWEQTCIDAKRIDKQPMLMIRENDWPRGMWEIYLRVGFYYLGPRMLCKFTGVPHLHFIVSSIELFNIDYNEFIKYLQS